MKLISVLDTKAQAFMNPATVRTTAEGLRAFETEVKNPQSQFHKHPSDFILHEIADFDELTGKVSPHNPLRVLATASEFV